MRAVVMSPTTMWTITDVFLRPIALNIIQPYWHTSVTYVVDVTNFYSDVSGHIKNKQLCTLSL